MIAGNTSLILIVAFWGVTTTSCYSSWAAIELNLIILLPMMANRKLLHAKFSSVKYLIVQRFAGILILRMILINNISVASPLWVLLINLFILFKLGAVPFYHWLLSVGRGQTWVVLFFLLTVQKFIPLFFIQIFSVKEILWLSGFRWAFLPWAVYILKNLKKIIIMSSTFIIISILAAILIKGRDWKGLMALYTLTFIPLLGVSRRDSGNGTRPKRPGDEILTATWLLLIANLVGIPPLPGFFIKLEIRIGLISGAMWGAIFIFNLGAGVIVFMYVSFLIRKLSYSRFGIKNYSATSAPRIWLLGALSLAPVLL